jgi:hypothetical protein
MALRGAGGRLDDMGGARALSSIHQVGGRHFERQFFKDTDERTVVVDAQPWDISGSSWGGCGAGIPCPYQVPNFTDSDRHAERGAFLCVDAGQVPGSITRGSGNISRVFTFGGHRLAAGYLDHYSP